MRRPVYRLAAAALILILLAVFGARAGRIAATADRAPPWAAAGPEQGHALALYSAAAVIQFHLLHDGGCTVDPRSGAPVGGVDAYAVSLAGYEARFSKTPSRQQIEAYLQRHTDLLAKSRRLFVGAWRDRAGGCCSLDLTELISDKATALARGRDNEQRCIYHLGRRQEIFLTAEVVHRQ
jgi:hypothetical protein